MATDTQAKPRWGWEFWTPVVVIVLAGAISTALLRGWWAAFSDWLDHWQTLIAGVIGGGLTLAAGILAYRGARGAAQQQIAEDKARAREVERAYVSGGGARASEQLPGPYDDLFGRPTIVPVPTNEFQLHINNHGKTPAYLRYVAIGFCDASDPPPEPVYDEIRFRWNDAIGPGQQGRVIKNVDIPVGRYDRMAICGRYYWDDIWGTHWSSGFVYEIPWAASASISIETPATYWDDRPGDYPESYDRPEAAPAPRHPADF